MYGRLSKEHHRSKTVYQFNTKGELLKEWDSLMDIQRELNFNIGHISAVCTGKRHQANGFIWSHTKECKSFNGVCPICDKEFLKPSYTSKFCSKECREKAYYQPREREHICIICNKEFKTTRKSAICCSDECKHERKLRKNRELHLKKSL